MQRHRVTTPLLGVVLASLVLAMLPAGKLAAEDGIKDLLRQRQVALGEAHDLQIKAYQTGQVPLAQVLQAGASLRRAKLDLCDAAEDRIKAHEEMVEAAGELLGLVKKLAAAAQGTRVDVLQAEAHHLEAQFALARAKEETKSSHGEELQVGKRYHFVPVGKDFDEPGTLGEVLAVEKGWVKVATFLPQPRRVWINLGQVGAIKTTEAVPGDARPDPDAVEAGGEITFDEARVARLSAGAAGTVWQLEKAPGQAVRKGDVLAVVSAPEAGRARAEFLQAHADADLKGKLLDRLRAAGEAVPARAVVEAEAAQLQARAGLTRARQALVDLGLPVQVEDLKGLAAEEVARRVQFLGLPEDLVKKLDPKAAPANLVALRAPLDGVVVAREAVIGEGVDAPKTLFVVADMSRMWLTLRVPLADAGRLAIGQTVRFRPVGGAADLDGKVTWISPAVDEKTRTVQVRAELPNPDGRLRANAPGRGRISTKAEKD